VAKTSYSFGHHGFPRPLHQPGSPWLNPLPGHAGAVASTAAAVVAGGITWIAMPPHPGVPPAGAATPNATGGAGPAFGRDGQPEPPGGSATAQPSALPMAIGSSGAQGPVAAVTATPVATGTNTSVAAGPGGSTSASASPSDAPGAGTLSVRPATLTVAPPASGSITLTASGGTVNWSISEPPGLQAKVVVAPMSGTLAAGQTTTVSVTAQGPGKPRVHLTFFPGGAVVTVVIS
jgi:hypothetical protein